MVTKKARRDMDSTIPSSFHLAGCEWVVMMVPELPDMGLCNPSTYEIHIRDGMNEQATVATFFHELVHAVKFTMGETGHDEKEVEGFGNLLCQWYKTRQKL